MRVFICSTCYDLIDLRAELKDVFRNAGVSVCLSDSPTSDFQVKQDCNSIETCLANVRECDEFIIILSNRYGPSLGAANYGNISATHLEYRTAKESNKRIRMYVRDRLEGDYATWKKNSDKTKLTLPWCEKEDWGIFDILKEHRLLEKESPQSNWVSIFRNSVELKEIISRDFKEVFAREFVRKLTLNGKAPYFEVICSIKSGGANTFNALIRIRNLGEVVAISPTLEIHGLPIKFIFDSIPPIESREREFTWNRVLGRTYTLTSHLQYSLLDGSRLSDVAEIVVQDELGLPNVINYILKEKRYISGPIDLLKF
ncbi:MAG TPA: DUF4062 domain-containing protein [Opitutales bacterium]|jgi:hypothetical protein|nr:DUF4062 domain-containing protein [Opitutales bacterium]